MHSTLSPQLKAQLRQSFTQVGFSTDVAIAKLVSNGYDETTAKNLIITEFKAYKQELFQQADRRNKSEEAKKVVPIVVIMISIIGPVFEITSTIWYICAIAIAGIAGYWGYKPRPIAGLLGCMVVPLVLPFAYNFYFTGRTSYIKIEMLIPMLIAAAPAAIVYFIISKTVYANVEN